MSHITACPALPGCAHSSKRVRILAVPVVEHVVPEPFLRLVVLHVRRVAPERHNLVPVEHLGDPLSDRRFGTIQSLPRSPGGFCHMPNVNT
jgi:hypothetical protein